jgi:ribosomal protein L23
MRDAQSIIKRPLLTEKSARLRETGGGSAKAEGETYAQQVVFEVARDANKIEIRQAARRSAWVASVVVAPPGRRRS